jgi:hypothetical protein
MRFRYVRYCTSLDVRDYWRSKEDGNAQYIEKWSQCKGRLCAHATHTYTQLHSTGTNLKTSNVVFCVVIHVVLQEDDNRHFHLHENLNLFICCSFGGTHTRCGYIA